jgi:hypothetical protein
MFMQWRIVSESYKKMFDNETEARRAYGKLSKEITEEGEGSVEMFAREEYGGEWTLVQEFILGDQDEDED